MQPPPSAEGTSTMPAFCLWFAAGVRKEFDVEGRKILMFWYRNQMYAIEARSPAEGAYSEGFIRAKFTQVTTLVDTTSGSSRSPLSPSRCPLCALQR